MNEHVLQDGLLALCKSVHHTESELQRKRSVAESVLWLVWPRSFSRPLLWHLRRTGGMQTRPGAGQVSPKPAGISPSTWARQQQGMPSQGWQYSVICGGFALH